MLLAVSCSVTSSSCSGRRRQVVHDSFTGDPEVVITRGHVHTARCGHYRRHGRWYFAGDHVHGGGCGHAWVNGVWIVR